jgi:hypothetical protein
MKKVSKSIQFSDDTVEDLETMALSLGYSRVREGDERGDVSKMVQRAVDFMLDNEAVFRQWMANGSTSIPQAAPKAVGSRK